MKLVNKIMLVLAIATMVAVPMVAVDGTSTETTPSTDADYNFYLYDEVDGWIPTTSSGYNAYEAVKKITAWNVVGDDNYTTTSGYYTTINPDYGTISSLDGLANGTETWHVYYYSEETHKWTSGTEALGFYKAFNDYDINLRAANIAFDYNSLELTTTQLDELPTTGLKPTVSVLNNNAFKFTFHLSVNPVYTTTPAGVDSEAWNTLKNNQGTHYGYGSDAYLALKNAITSTVGNDEAWSEQYNAVDSNGYGAFTQMYGVKQINKETPYVDDNGKQMIEGEYDNYTIYLGSSIGSGTFASFLLGFFTPSGVNLDPQGTLSSSGSEFCIDYNKSIFSWPVPEN